MLSEFPGNSTIAQLLPEFYRKYNLNADGGLSDSYIKIELYKNFHFYLPNIDARRKAVLKHDIHHIITGYKSDFKGETEISAWEIASGCRKYWVAIVLDLSGMAWGYAFNLPGVFRAFVRGKRTRNLYENTIPDNVAINMTVDQLREQLGLNNETAKSATLNETLSFFAWAIAGIVYSFLSLLLLPAIVIYSVFIAIRTASGN